MFGSPFWFPKVVLVHIFGKHGSEALPVHCNLRSHTWYSSSLKETCSLASWTTLILSQIPLIPWFGSEVAFILDTSLSLHFLPWLSVDQRHPKVKSVAMAPLVCLLNNEFFTSPHSASQ